MASGTPGPWPIRFALQPNLPAPASLSKQKPSRDTRKSSLAPSAARFCAGDFARCARRQHRLRESMPNPALVLPGITKRFPKQPERQDISSALKQLAHAAGLLPEPVPKRGRSVIESVDLTLGSGEIAILVGAPGCGKTSLLKIAAGLMRPTAGVVRVEGGSSSLIYPECGLHTALTGRENIILRALMEGLPISEARARCGRIARFAEIDSLLDRPVREYSDVMLVRLAFGVMAFLESRV